MIFVAVGILSHKIQFKTLEFSGFDFHNSLKNKRQTEFYFYSALRFVIWLGYLTTNHNDYKLLKNSIL